jgi:hypothetical protein
LFFVGTFAHAAQTSWVIFQARSGNEMRPAARAKLRPGDEIRTTSATEADVFFGRQAWIHLSPNSVLKIEELQTNDRGLLATGRLLQGQAFAKSQRKGENLQLWVRLSSGAVRLAPEDASTIVLVQRPERSEAAIAEGAVQVSIGTATVTLSDRNALTWTSEGAGGPTEPSREAKALLESAKNASMAAAYEVIERIEDPSQARESNPFSTRHDRSGSDSGGPIEDEARPTGEFFPKNEENLE